MADADGVAVGRGAGDPADADRAAGAGDVLDNDRLAERGAHALGHDTPNRIGRASGRERHDHHHGARRIGLRHGKAGAAQDGGECGDDEYQLAHVPSRLIGAAFSCRPFEAGHIGFPFCRRLFSMRRGRMMTGHHIVVELSGGPNGQTDADSHGWLRTGDHRLQPCAETHR
jgi:hypothetical protein